MSNIIGIRQSSVIPIIFVQTCKHLQKIHRPLHFKDFKHSLMQHGAVTKSKDQEIIFYGIDATKTKLLYRIIMCITHLV